MSIDTDLQVTITAMAQETIFNCQNRIHAVRAAFGEQEGDRLAASFGRSFTRLISMGGTISRDGEFSLLGCNHMTVGMVFSPEDQVTTYKRWLKHDRDLFDSQEFLWTLPASGEWSLHS